MWNYKSENLMTNYILTQSISDLQVKNSNRLKNLEKRSSSAKGFSIRLITIYRLQFKLKTTLKKTL